MSSTFVPPCAIISLTHTTTHDYAQTTAVCTTIDGTKIVYDGVGILTLVEEDGELKVLEWKDFPDPEKRNNLHSWVAKALARGTAVA